jgi:hypothetical protein
MNNRQTYHAQNFSPPFCHKGERDMKNVKMHMQNIPQTPYYSMQPQCKQYSTCNPNQFQNFKKHQE